MKKNVFFIGIILLTLGMSACNSQKNADKAAEITFDGTYTGTLPCADCSGIQTTLELKKDMSYVLKMTYLGKLEEVVSESNGKFEWSSKANIVTLDNKASNGTATKYLVGEGTLTQLDTDGNKITGEHADMYILKKVDSRLVEKYWKLTEIMGKPVEAANNAKEAHIIFKIDGNRVNGTGGCNSFMGSYDVETGNRIHFSKMASTMMACLHMETEQQMLQVLEMADNYSINGDTLTLNKARMAPLARFEVVYLK